MLLGRDLRALKRGLTRFLVPAHPCALGLLVAQVNPYATMCHDAVSRMMHDARGDAV